MAEPRTPLERLAQLQSTPVPKKMVPVVKPVKVTGKSGAQDDPWGVLGGTTVTTTPTATSPGGQNFVGPTLDPTVIQKRAELTAAQTKALQSGVAPATVESIVSGKGDPNAGFKGVANWLGSAIKNVYSIDVVPGAGKIQPFVKVANVDIIPGQKEFKPIKGTGKAAATIGVKALVAASPALDKLDFGRRVVTSTLKEIGDEVAVWRGTRERGKAGQGEFRGKGGFSASDWWKQLSKEGGITGGEFFADVKNPYVNQTMGFLADVFLDPVTYVAGPAGLGETAVERGLITGATKQGERIAARAAAAQADNFAAALARKTAEEALDFAIITGDNAGAKAAEEAIAIADKQAAAAAKKLAGDAAGRTYGRTSNQALAERVLGMRDEAQRVVDLGTGTAEELAYAQRTVDVLTDDVIKNIQSKGLAGIAGPLWDIAKGERTAAQNILGVRGGLRITNPLAVFGGPGPLRAIIPGTERITNIAGKLIAESRLGLGRTALGAKVINNITPTGEGGLLGSADLLELRTGLRRGTLTPQEAQEATRLIALDNQYRALVQNERKVAAGYLASSGLGDASKYDPKVLNEVIRLRQTAAMTGIPAAFNAEQQAAADAIDKAFNYFFDYAAKASGGTGYIPPRRANYFPQMQSDEALRWAQANPKEAEKLAKALQVDRTWFVGNFRSRELQPGDKFFGKVLTQADIDGGPTALNQIARNWGLKFDYFETDVRTVLNKYANKHAQFSALQKTIGSLPENIPTMAARKVGTEFKTIRPTTGFKVPFTDFTEPSTGLAFNTSEVLSALSEGQLKSLIDDAKTILESIQSKVVNKDEVKRLTESFNKQLDDIAFDFANGTITPQTASVLSDEVIKSAKVLEGYMNAIPLELNSISPTRWSEYADIVKKGFEVLNDDIIDPMTGNVLYKGTAPNIVVREELANLLRNANRMKDPEFAAKVKQLTQDYTRFSKAWLTARPGFFIRNAFSNTFQLVAAGADPRFLSQSIGILNEVNAGLKEGLTVRQVAERLVNSKKVSILEELFDFSKEFKTRDAVIKAIEDAINYSGSTGFGQYGEIASELGLGSKGILQKGKPRNKLSEVISRIPAWTRQKGETIENYSRFGLMWYGISKGLTPQEAIARANKYLIDYADLSTVDKVAKQIIPFWTFMSRNTPLQLELMWTNPRAYAFYSNLKRNVESKEERYIPSYEKDRGTFALKSPWFGGDIVRPGLPFPGGGENVIGGLINEPKKFLANVNPILRAPFEAFITGEKFFTGGKVVPKEWTDKPTGEKLKYLFKELYSPASPLQSYLRAIPFVSRRPFMQKMLENVFGINADEAQAGTQEVNSLLSLLGLPVGQKLRTDQQIREIESRIYDLGDASDAAKARQKKAESERIQNIQPGVTTESDPWGVLGP